MNNAGLPDRAEAVSLALSIVALLESSFHFTYTRIFLVLLGSSNAMLAVISSLKLAKSCFAPSSIEYPVATISVTELCSAGFNDIVYLKATSTAE